MKGIDMDIMSEAYYQELQRRLMDRLIEMSQSDEGLLQYRPPPLSQRIWGKFCTLAQWVNFSRN